MKEIDRREFLKFLLCTFARGFVPSYDKLLYEKELAKIRIDNLWGDGHFKPTYFEICGVGGGQVQVRRLAEEGWEEELPTCVFWTHMVPNSPFAFRGLFFVHRNNFDLIAGDRDLNLKGNRVKVYVNFQHENPYLEGIILGQRVYAVDSFDTYDDEEIKKINNQGNIMAIVTCDPSGCTGDGCVNRKVIFVECLVPR